MNNVAPYTILNMATKFEAPNKNIVVNDKKNPNNLYPDFQTKRIDQEVIPGFLISTRVRESKSAIQSAGIDYNRWQYFKDGETSSWGSVKPFM